MSQASTSSITSSEAKKAKVPFRVACAMNGVNWGNETVFKHVLPFTKEHLFSICKQLHCPQKSGATRKELATFLDTSMVDPYELASILEKEFPREKRKGNECYGPFGEDHCEDTLKTYKEEMRREKVLQGLVEAFFKTTPKTRLPDAIASLEFRFWTEVEAPHNLGPLGDWSDMYGGGEEQYVYLHLDSKMTDRSTAVFTSVERRKEGRFKISLSEEYTFGRHKCSVLRLIPYLDESDHLTFRVRSGEAYPLECTRSWTSEGKFVGRQFPSRFASGEYSKTTCVDWENPHFVLKRKAETIEDDDDENTPITELHKRHKQEQALDA